GLQPKNGKADIGHRVKYFPDTSARLGSAASWTSGFAPALGPMGKGGGGVMRGRWAPWVSPAEAKPVRTGPGWQQFAVTPEPASRSASSTGNGTWHNLEALYPCWGGDLRPSQVG